MFFVYFVDDVFCDVAGQHRVFGKKSCPYIHMSAARSNRIMGNLPATVYQWITLDFGILSILAHLSPRYEFI
jgi:hypothetical protein